MIEVAGYVVIVAVAVAYGLRSQASLPDALRRVIAQPAGRIIVLASWAWLGWHLFARGSGAFE